MAGETPDARVIERYHRVRSLLTQGTTEGEREAARGRVAEMEARYAGLRDTEDPREAPRVRRRESPPPSATTWTPPPVRPAPPREYGTAPVWHDPDAFTGRPWERSPARVTSSPARSRFEDRSTDLFDDFGHLPPGYGR